VATKANPSAGGVYTVDVGDSWVVLQLVQAVWMAHVSRVLGRFDALPDQADWGGDSQQFVTKIDVAPLLRAGRAVLLGTAPVPVHAWSGRTIGRTIGRDGLPGLWQVQDGGVWRPYEPSADDRRTLPTNDILLNAADIANQLRLSTEWALDDWEVRQALYEMGEGPQPTPLKHSVGRLRLSFDTRRQADQSRADAEAVGWRVERRGSADRGWLLLLDRHDGSVPVESESDAALSALAETHGGEFLGVEPHP